MTAALVEPAYCTQPESFTTLGPEVGALARGVGFGPDRVQQLALDMMYAANQDQTWAAFEFCAIGSRQNFKTGLFKMAAIADLFLFNVELVTWTAHLFDTAYRAFTEIRVLVNGSDALSSRVRKITEDGNGAEIILTNGCQLQFRARSNVGGTGKTGAIVFLDEGWALQDTHIGSLYPTTATLPGAQIRIGSSAGHAKSSVLRSIRDRGRRGDPDLAYLEYADKLPPSCAQGDSCDHRYGVEGCCLDDRSRWRCASPTMGYRITEARIASFRRSMSAHMFAREFLGWWDEAADEIGLNFDNWPLIIDTESEPVGRVTYGIATSLDREWSAIALAGNRADGLRHIDVGYHRRGTGWVIAAAVEIGKKEPGATFVIDTGGPASSLIPGLEAAGVLLEPVTLREVGQAHGLFMDAIGEKTIMHRDQYELNAAVNSAKPRNVGDGIVLLGRKASGEDIAPLEASELALFGHVKFESNGPSLW